MTYLFFRNTEFYMQTSQKLVKFEISKKENFIFKEYSMHIIAIITAFAMAKVRIFFGVFADNMNAIFQKGAE